MPLIIAAQLARVASKAVPHVVTAIVDHADDVLPRYGIVTPLRLQHFVAQVLIETGYLRAVEENLSYTAARLHEVWPHVFPSLAAAAPYEHRPEALADLVYGHRMGNSQPGDGWANRGLGLLQNTGHDGRARLAGVLHATPDQVSAMLVADAWMLECAAADFVALGCLPHADRDDLEGVTRCINGGLNGLADRQAALRLCRKIWTPAAVISPSALIPKPIPLAGALPVTPTETARLVGAIERIATAPQTAVLAQRLLDGAVRGVGAQPDNGLLAGKKTYIVAALGVASTLMTVGLAMAQGGGLTPAGWCAAITALVTSGGFAALRAGVKSHCGEIASLVLSVGQSMALSAIGADGATAPTLPDGVADAADQVAADVTAAVTR